MALVIYMKSFVAVCNDFPIVCSCVCVKVTANLQ